MGDPDQAREIWREISRLHWNVACGCGEECRAVGRSEEGWRGVERSGVGDMGDGIVEGSKAQWRERSGRAPCGRGRLRV